MRNWVLGYSHYGLSLNFSAERLLAKSLFKLLKDAVICLGNTLLERQEQDRNN